MNHKDYKEVEDFLIDDTFQQYCSEENEQCIAYWNNYITQHPDQKEVILRAQRLYSILTGNKKNVNHQIEKLRSALNKGRKSSPINKWYQSRWLQIAAIFTVLGFSYLWFTTKSTTILAPEQMITSTEVYQTVKGEKKTFKLTDGTVVNLNAGSKLRVDKNFGELHRQVFLEGEAYFDVTKDQEKPFILHTNEFDIQVLGTSFNVKAYPEELSSEAVLIEGLIELKSKGKNENSIIIKPNQKVTIYKNNDVQSLKIENKNNNKPLTIAPVKEIAIKDIPEESQKEIAAIAWKENKLTMEDQDFNELKSILERWYDVRIILEGKNIGDYRFTATFREENIEQVLLALQKVKPFKFKIYEKNITIYE